MDALALLGLAAVLLIKEAGVPIPIPGDLLVLGAGVATGGDLALATVTLAVILAAGYLGGSLQFLLARGALRRALVGLLVRFGLSVERLDSLAAWLRRRGLRGVAVARMTPGVRVGAIAASGLAALPFGVFLSGLVVGNAIFVGGHFLLGYAVGPAAIDAVAGSGPIAIGLGAFVALGAAGAIGWSVLRRRRAAALTARTPADDGAYAAWADAACPACLALAVLRTVEDGAGARP